MITPRTQAAIAQLNHIHAGSYDSCPEQHIPAEEAAATHRHRTYHSKR